MHHGAKMEGNKVRKRKKETKVMRKKKCRKAGKGEGIYTLHVRKYINSHIPKYLGVSFRMCVCICVWGGGGELLNYEGP
jgi:hypothetical protein